MQDKISQIQDKISQIQDEISQIWDQIQLIMLRQILDHTKSKKEKREITELLKDQLEHIKRQKIKHPNLYKHSQITVSKN